MNSEILRPADIFTVNVPDPTIIGQVFSNYMGTYAWVLNGIHPTKNGKHIFPSVVLGMMEFAGGGQNEGDNGK